MSLIPILPTGAMASGDYVDYMIGYLDLAMEDVNDNLKAYLSDEIMDGWNEKWTQMTNDMDVELDDLASEINILRAKILIARDGINNA